MADLAFESYSVEPVWESWRRKLAWLLKISVHYNIADNTMDGMGRTKVMPNSVKIIRKLLIFIPSYFIMNSVFFLLLQNTGVVVKKK